MANTGEKHESPPRTPTQNHAIDPFLNSSPPVPPKRHGRSRSYSNVDERTNNFTAGDSAFGNVEIRIDQYDGPSAAEEDVRPRTAGAGDPEQQHFQSLDVHIPHYNLGSPRFSPSGTPFLYGSSSIHLPSIIGEAGSSTHASTHSNMQWLWPPKPLGFPPPGTGADITASINSTIAPNVPGPKGAPSSSMPTPIEPRSLAASPFPAPVTTLSSLPLIPSPPVPQVNGPLNIDPSIFDDLTFPPGSEDPSVVRYDKKTGEIYAASPTRIIAQITPAAFVDYHLLSDFFLTYRLFMNTHSLASHLLSRLQWAMQRGDDTGKVIRVRTFVAIRHWLLNYFADDFVPSLPFRQEFVHAMNTLTRNVQATGDASDLKILGELKKCWRATCALYWDHMEEEAHLGVRHDIVAGGPPGTRQEELVDATEQVIQRIMALSPPPRLSSVGHGKSSASESFLRDAMQSKDGQPKDPRKGKMAKSTKSADSDVTPPGSQGGSGLSMSASGKRLRAGHKRSASFSDALRDNRQLPSAAAKTTAQLAMQMTMPYTGSLVRGNMFPPTPAKVEVIAPSTPAPGSTSGRSVSLTNSTAPSTIEIHSPKPQHGPGMKRLFGTMRRAFGAKAPPLGGKKTKDSSAKHKSRKGSGESRKRSDMSLLELAAANASTLRMGVLGEGKVRRVDLLGARALEAFKRAMEDQASSDEGDWRGGEPGGRYSDDGNIYGFRRGSGMDGAADARTDMGAEMGSAMSYISDFEKLSDQQNSKGGSMGELKKDFLDSTSSLAPTPNLATPQHEAVSFLEDKSDQSSSEESQRVSRQKSHAVSGQGSQVVSRQSRQSSGQSSVIEEVAPLNTDLSRSSSSRSKNPRALFDRRLNELRRSKSFHFDRISPRFQTDMEAFGRTSSCLARVSPAFDIRSYNSGQSYSLRRRNSALSQFSSGQDDSSDFSHFTPSIKEVEDAPRGGLRRRPGGNLKTAATIGDLQAERPHSTGSMGTTSFSVYDTSELQPRPLRARALSPSTLASSHFSNTRRVGNGMLSLGAMGGGRVPSTPAQPVFESLQGPPEPTQEETVNDDEERKASFEAGVQMLRDLPDDETDDGIDVALAKLEGTYQRKPSGATSPMFELRKSVAKSSRHEIDSSVVMVEPDRTTTGYDGSEGRYTYDERQERLKRRHKQVVDHAPLQTPPIFDGARSGSALQLGLPSPDTFPIPGPGTGRAALRRTAATVSSDALARTGVNTLSAKSDNGKLRTSAPSMVDLRRIDHELERHLESRQTRRVQRDDASELSSEISFEMVESKRSSFKFPPISSGTVIEELGIASHPLRHPPSPPMTLSQALSLSPKTGIADTASTPRANLSNSSRPRARTTTAKTVPEISTATVAPTQPSTEPEPTAHHLPFILSYDSLLLAQQLTLIEKDALTEIDWKELVELSWRQTSSQITNWVSLLSTPNLRGVEVIIARFNLMCKWARSEVVMTKSIDERARTIVKLIHISAHSRRLGNYATMYQITIALLTADITRLRKTWELVPTVEKETFRELEALVQPSRNFFNLRNEMEKATGESGCIPFVGMLFSLPRPVCSVY